MVILKFSHKYIHTRASALVSKLCPLVTKLSLITKTPVTHTISKHVLACMGSLPKAVQAGWLSNRQTCSPNSVDCRPQVKALPDSSESTRENVYHAFFFLNRLALIKLWLFICLVYTCVYMCHSTYEEVRGQDVEADYLLNHVDPQKLGLSDLVASAFSLCAILPD